MRAWTRAALGAVVLVAAACTGSNPENEQTPVVDEVRIGVLAPLTGANRVAGQDALRGAQLAAALVNGEEGPVPLLGVTDAGLRGLGGPKIAIVPADTGSDPSTSPARGAAQAANLVTQERVVGLVGAYDAEVTAAASQRTERLGVPFVNGDTSTGYLTERGLDWFFRTGPTDRMFGEAFFSTLKQEKVRPKRISILYTTDAPGEGLHRVLHNLAPEADYDEHGMVKFTPGKPNLVPELTTLRDEKDPEVLFLVTSKGSDAVRALETMGSMGYRPPEIFAFGGGFSEPQVLQSAGTVGEGLFYSSAWSREVAARNPSAKPIMDRYEGRFGAAMSEVAAGSFTAVLTLAAAIDAAGSVDPKRVRAALIGLDLPGRSTIMPWSGVRFDASHQNARAAGLVEQVVQGGFRVVFPNELAQAQAA
jgi:branched-chain amino acid transport system substrate-binding protein